MTTETNPLQELKDLKRAYENAVKSRGQEVLDYLFKQLFDDIPDVRAVRWRQYTPYFNDGDPCTFRVSDPYFGVINTNPLVVDHTPDEEDDDDWDLSREEINARRTSGIMSFYDEYTFYHGSEYDRETRSRSFTYKSPGQKAVHEALVALAKGLDQIEDILLAIFGDHVTVTVTREGYTIEEYSHD